MTGLSHEDVDAFLDNELDPDRADAFRLHLPECEACQERLERAIHLKAMAAIAYPAPLRPDVPAPPARRPARPRWAFRNKSVLGAVMVAFASGALMLMVMSPHQTAGTLVVMEGDRELEGRVTGQFAGRHRRYGAVRSGDKPVVRLVSLEQVAALEAQGDLMAAATVYLQANDLPQAERRLLDLPPSPERDANLAELARVSGKPERALELAAAALEKHPRMPEAMWNRALALRDLGFYREAAAGFREVAALGEEGWSGEASGIARDEEQRQRDRTPGVLDAADRRRPLRDLREQAWRELEAGRRAKADQLLLDVWRGCHAPGVDPRCLD
ncbi:MAG TPA: zf-HC2 domain-containing protein [Myxococcaceae bacterium]|jgi:anti-sigma factor RsiW